MRKPTLPSSFDRRFGLWVKVDGTRPIGCVGRNAGRPKDTRKIHLACEIRPQFNLVWNWKRSVISFRAPALPARIPSLDGLRAVSIVLVLVSHAAATAGAPGWLERSPTGWLGNVGVRFFFIISGFLITTLLLRDIERHGRIRIREFFKRRAWRILPAAYAYIAIMWALHVAGIIDLRYHLGSRQQVESAIPDLLHAITFTANYAHDYNWYFNHLWSLSVEEQFYILWPFTLLFLGVRGGLVAVASTVVVVPLIRLSMLWYGNGPEIALSREFQAVADTLAAGCLLALLHNHLKASKVANWLSGWPGVPLGSMLVAMGYGIALYSRPTAYVLGQTLANAGICLMIHHTVCHPNAWLGRLLHTPIAVGIGTLSYSLYLWQEPFLFFFSKTWATTYPQNIGLAVMAALASYYLVERPALKMKDRVAGPVAYAGAR